MKSAPSHMRPAPLKTSAVVSCTLSHSATDLRVGRLSSYVDHWGCQTLEEATEEVEGGSD